MDFTLQEVKCYTQNFPDAFSNLSFYFSFGYETDRFCFTSEYLPGSTKFRSTLLEWIKSHLWSAQKDDSGSHRALKACLKYLHKCQKSYEKLLELEHDFPRPVVIYASKMLRQHKESPLENQILNQILRIITIQN